VGISP
jgi:hypothetical protein